MIKQASLIAAAVLALAGPAAADTLYVAGPPAAAPGHPMHLGADHRASQVGDLVHIVFNFNGNANNSDTSTMNNTYSNTLGAGSGRRPRTSCARWSAAPGCQRRTWGTPCSATSSTPR